MDDFEPGDRGADLEPVVVDRQGDEAGFEAAGPYGFGTGFRATLPFLDPSALAWADGVPLRVAGMTLPVGLERLYFVGLAAPRGPQLPVYSAQARLIARFLTAQERSGIALSNVLASGVRPEARIDIPRHEWTRDMDRTTRRIKRILLRTPDPWRSGNAPSRDYLAIHG